MGEYPSTTKLINSLQQETRGLKTINADLLAALEAMLSTHGYTDSCGACSQARAAIARARMED